MTELLEMSARLPTVLAGPREPQWATLFILKVVLKMLKASYCILLKNADPARTQKNIFMKYKNCRIVLKYCCLNLSKNCEMREFNGPIFKVDFLAMFQKKTNIG